jgi:nucleotide-binding universal stress UspA family protein
MFKRILVPTDGSEISKRVMQDCMKFAKELGAEVIGLSVAPPYSAYVYQAQVLADAKDRFDDECTQFANRCLADLKTAAKEFGVKCETFYVVGDFPFESIIQIAKDKHCDLIAMASHGRKGIKGFLLGSETNKVLTHSQIPVLVFR